MAERLFVSGARGASFAEVARRVGTIAGVPVPPDATDAQVLDLIAGGLAEVVAAAGYSVIEPVRVATTANVTHSGFPIIDGVQTVNGDRILDKNNSNPALNGIWVAAAGFWSRATDFDGTGEAVQGSYVLVKEGATQGGAWVLTTPGTITIGTTAQTWQPFRLDQALTLRTALLASGGSGLIGNIDGGTGASAETVQQALRRGYLFPDQFLSPGQVLGAGSNDFSAFQKMFDASAASGRPMGALLDSSGYRIDGILQAHDNLELVGFGRRPMLYSTVAGQGILACFEVDNVSIRNMGFQGANATTVPDDDFLVYDPANLALLSFAECENIDVEGCYFDRFYNGLTFLNCLEARMRNNRVRRFYRQGILGSLSRVAWIERNYITESQVVTGTQSYGIQVTGDAAGAGPQGAAPSSSINILYNTVHGVPSWDGIMSHDADSIAIVGNETRDTRMAIDVGDFEAGNQIGTVLIAHNRCFATTTDTWGGAAANHLGIGVVGLSGSERDSRIIISSNLVHGFFNISGMTGTAGVSSHITVGNADNVEIGGNEITGGGNAYSNAGILLFGTLNQISLGTNNMQGAFSAAGVRIAGATVDLVTIERQLIKQTNTSDPAIQYSGTIGNMALSMPATNSTVPVSAGGTVAYAPGGGPVFKGSATYDPPSLAAGAKAQTNVTVTGIVPGDHLTVGFSNDPQGVKLSAYCNTANNAVVDLDNPTVGTVDLASGVLTVTGRRQ